MPVPLVMLEVIPVGANPLAVPLFVIVQPEGTVNVSPESPRVKEVPDAGEILSTFSSLVIYTPNNLYPAKYEKLPSKLLSDP